VKLTAGGFSALTLENFAKVSKFEIFQSDMSLAEVG
jgi:hypothetical protein